MPIQIYAWSDQPQPEFHHLAAAGIIVLLGILLPMNAVAVVVRAWRQGKKTW
jgi:phosphate transport system permease protein